MKSVSLKRCFIEPHQARLSNCRTGLYRWKILWSLRKSHQHHPCADRSTADQETLVTNPNDLRHLAGQTSQLLRIQCVSGRFGEDSRSKLDNDALPFIRHTKPVYIVTS